MNAVASVLGLHCNLRDYVSHVVGCVVSLFDCFQSAKLQRNVGDLRGLRLIIDTVIAESC